MEIVRAILVNLAVPLAGFQVYIWVRNKMLDEDVEHPPVVPLFIIFATYGGWLLIFLTLLFWYWSGMALLGLMYLVFLAPIVMIVLAVMLYRQRELSNYHFGLFIASGIYPCLIGALFVVKWLTGYN
jgi:hypothetical protein